jgi:hypothetical protein
LLNAFSELTDPPTEDYFVTSTGAADLNMLWSEYSLSSTRTGTASSLLEPSSLLIAPGMTDASDFMNMNLAGAGHDAVIDVNAEQHVQSSSSSQSLPQSDPWEYTLPSQVQLEADPIPAWMLAPLKWPRNLPAPSKCIPFSKSSG